MEEARAEAVATLRCAECGRPHARGELWRIYYADIAEAVIYCQDCAKREFGLGGERLGGPLDP